MIPTNDPDYSTVRQIAHLKGDLVHQLFHQLVDVAKRLREPDEFVVGYALLMLSNPSMIEMMVNYQFDPDHKSGYAEYDTSLYSRGDSPFINAGQFNLDDLLSAQ